MTSDTQTQQQAQADSHTQSMDVLAKAWEERAKAAGAAWKTYAQAVGHPPYNTFTPRDYLFTVERDDLSRAMQELSKPMSLAELDSAAGVQRPAG